jgi:hypothetical protein
MLELLGSGEGPDVEPIAQSRSRYLGRLSIKSAGRVLFLDTSEIDWIEAADYYVKLHVGGKSHLLRETMNNLEDRLRSCAPRPMASTPCCWGTERNCASAVPAATD